MDLVLGVADRNLLTPYVYPSSWPEDNIYRQILTLYVITIASAWGVYIVTASFGYLLFFDKRYKLHPNYLPNQVSLEIAYASWSIPYIGVATVPLFLLEVRGYSKLYSDITINSVLDANSTQQDQFMLGSLMDGWPFVIISIITFLMFTDCFIYWIHRGLHHRFFYTSIHKPHHKWKISTPFASHAFHPIDGFLQSLPYHIYPFLFPLHKITYLVLFVFVNMWTVSIHDSDYRVPTFLQPFVNGSAHHTDHHLLFKYNYGQFFTLWDRIGGSFRYPTELSGNSLLDEVDIINDKKLKKK